MRRRRPAQRRSAHSLLRWESLGHAVTGLEALEQRQMMAANLAITLTDDLVAGIERQYYTPGSQVVYTLKVTNTGDTAATGATLTTALAPAISQATWTAAYSPGTQGSMTYDDAGTQRPVANVRAGMGNLDMDLTVAAGGTATFTIIATVGAAATGNLVSRAQVVLGDVTRSATDTDTFVPQSAVVTSAAGWTSDSLVQLVDPATGSTLEQAFAFEPGLKTGVNAAMGDLDGDGKAEIICTPGRGRLGEVVVFRQVVNGSGNVTLVKDASFGSLVPFAGWRRGLEVVAGDFDGDGDDDVAVAQTGGAGAIAVLRAVPLGPQRLVVDRTFTVPEAAGPAGVALAAGDFGTFNDGVATPNASPDGRAELVVASRGGVAPIVTIVDMSSTEPAVVDTIEPFSGYIGGLSVTVARIGRDSIPDLLIAQGRGGASQVEVYDGRQGVSARLLAGVTAFADLGRAAAVRTAALDTDGDGRADRIMAAQGGAGATGIRSFTVSTTEATGAVTISASGAAAGAASRLRVAAAALRNTKSLFTTDSGLQFVDLEPGTGAVLGNKQVTVDYTGTYNPTGGSLAAKVFDTSKVVKNQPPPEPPAQKPFTFTIGSTDPNTKVIDGWNEGVATMKVGGVRQLIVPTRLAYSTGNLAGKTLAFEVKVNSTP